MALRAISSILRRLPPSVRKGFRSRRDSHMDEILAFHHERDPQENVESSPPEGEYIDLCCTWGVEFYTPTHFANLKSGFRKLGWHTDDHPDPHRDPITWLDGLRRHQYGGSWMNLGYLVPKDSGPILPGADKRVVPLPSCVEYASGGIYEVSPSLVSVVVCFVFDENTSSMFDRALRTDRQTYTTRVPRGWQVHSPREQKSAHIAQIRTSTSREVGSWFAENLPGLFSSGILDYEIPTCELLTIREAEPFPSQNEREDSFQDYLDVMGLWRDFDAWESSRIPGLKFRMPDSGDNSPPYHSLLTINEGRHIDTIPDYYGGSGKEARILHVDSFMPSMLRLWSILPMLEGYTQHLNDVRDSATIRRTGRSAPAKVLGRLGVNVGYSVDIAAVTSELRMYSEDSLPLVHDVEPFEPCDRQFYESGMHLRKRLESIIEKRVAWLERTDRSLRDHLTQYGSLVGAAENVRLQRKITFLTWVLLFLTVATLLITASALLMESGRLWEFMVEPILNLVS